MREILFRAKTRYGDVWIEGALLKDNVFTYILSGDPRVTIGLQVTTEVEEVLPETVGQYIGQKDKYGKKIFEGDVLHCKYDHHKYLVKIDEYGVYTRDERGEKFILGRIHNDFEIVGNIHDQKEDV